MSATRHGLRLYFFLVLSGMGIYLPFLPPWLEAQGIHGLQMGAVVACRPVTMIVAPIVFGLVADAWGFRASLLRWACLGAVLTFALLGIVGRLGMLSFAWVLPLVFVFSFLRAPLSSIADVSTLESAGSYGSVRLWGSLGFVAATLLIGPELALQSPSALPWTVAALFSLAFFATFAVPSRRGHERRPVWGQAFKLLKRSEFLAFLLLIFGWQLSHSAYDLTLGLHIRDLGAQNGSISAAWAIGALAEVVVMATSARWLAWRGLSFWFLLALSVTAIRWVLLGSLTSLPWLLAMQPLHAFSFGVVWIAAVRFVETRAEPRVLATAQGLFMASMALAGALGTMLWSRAYELLGSFAVYRASAALAAAVTVGSGVWAMHRGGAMGRRRALSRGE